MNNLKNMLSEIEGFIPKYQSSDTSVSQSNVGWQLMHVLLTLNGVVGVLQNSKPENYKWSFKVPRLIVFTMGKIPRGKAKAPKRVQPTTYDIKTLNSALTSAKANLKILEDLPNNKYFEHPYFGMLKKNKTIKFLEIHTQHHLDIVEDIIS